MANFKADYKNGFTLAEVLITLVVIGIIAAITIPALIENVDSKDSVVRLKKAYSVLNSASRLENSMKDFGGYHLVRDSIFDPNFHASSMNYNNGLKQYLNVAKDCGERSGCFAQNLKYMDGNPAMIFTGSEAYMMLADGTAIRTEMNVTQNQATVSNHVLNNTKGEMTVDINGLKGPNAYGKDIFMFHIVQDGTLVPFGVDGDRFSIDQCSFNGTFPGLSCAAWALYKENMDYLKGETMEHW